MTRRAVVGLDGLDLRDIEDRGDLSGWHALPIETTAHTCPSWNAIFTGEAVPGVHDFWKLPDEWDDGDTLAARSSEQWTYAELRERSADGYVWERDGVDVDVVSAPVVLPTYSTIDRELDAAIGWPTGQDEIRRSIRILERETFTRDAVITVFPVPDKANHLHDGSDGFDAADREAIVEECLRIAERVRAEFDEWLICSDHGRPGPAEEVAPGLEVASHDPVGVARSNAMDVAGRTNTRLADGMTELFT